jgi:hypothetical protein
LSRGFLVFCFAEGFSQRQVFRGPTLIPDDSEQASAVPLTSRTPADHQSTMPKRRSTTDASTATRQELLATAEARHPTFTSQKDFDAYVEKQHAIVEAPVMTNEACAQLNESRELAGYQKHHNRGTMQHRTIMSLADNPDELGDFLDKADQAAAGNGGEVINAFLNINRGASAGDAMEDEIAADAVQDEKTAGHDGGAWHRDSQSTEQVTGRLVMYYMLEGKRGCLCVRSGAYYREIVVPRGCAVYATRELLGLEHKHGANGVCVSIVWEVAWPTVPAPLTAEQIEVAERTQPPLPWTDHLLPWKPDDFFLGPARKHGQIGVGNHRRMAVSWLRGPRLGRGHPRAMTKEQARAIVEKLTPDERSDLASRQGARIGLWSPIKALTDKGVSYEDAERLAKRVAAAAAESPRARASALLEVSEEIRSAISALAGSITGGKAGKVTLRGNSSHAGRPTKSPHAPTEEQRAELDRRFADEPNPSSYSKLLKAVGMEATKEAIEIVKNIYTNARRAKRNIEEHGVSRVTTAHHCAMAPSKRMVAAKRAAGSKQLEGGKASA